MKPHNIFLLLVILTLNLPLTSFDQALVLCNESRSKSTAGEIVNLMSVDAQRLMDVMTYLNMIWSGPFQVGVSLYFLHQTMGWPIYAGLGVMIIFTPINFLIGRMVNKLQVFNVLVCTRGVVSLVLVLVLRYPCSFSAETNNGDS